jgi:MiaB/RimO family radical SAM methylthiotransferase
MKVFVEGFGCSLNQADTAAIKGLVERNNFQFSSPEKADYLIINTCAVKTPTEFRMLKRIRQLLKLKKKKSQLIVFGCLSEISPEKIKALGEEIILLGPKLAELSELLALGQINFSPNNQVVRANQYVSILPVCRGCLGACTYCCVKNARGRLQSYSPQELNQAFSQAIKETPEIWLTAQDLGAYGQDLGINLIDLLKTLLKNKGEFRIRLGMMNAQFLKNFEDELLELFKDERLYRFLHIPLQSGSDKILKAMKRNYSRSDFLALIRKLRKELPLLMLSTDVIVGFPNEMEKDFQQTVSALKAMQPDIVNISRYGQRPETEAAQMKNQVYGWVKKERSRILTKEAGQLSAQRNKLFKGRQKILVTEPGSKGNFQGRNNYYKPVIINQDLRGRFVDVEIEKVLPTYLKGKVLG